MDLYFQTPNAFGFEMCNLGYIGRGPLLMIQYVHNIHLPRLWPHLNLKIYFPFLSSWSAATPTATIISKGCCLQLQLSWFLDTQNQWNMVKIIGEVLSPRAVLTGAKYHLPQLLWVSLNSWVMERPYPSIAELWDALNNDIQCKQLSWHQSLPTQKSAKRRLYYLHPGLPRDERNGESMRYLALSIVFVQQKTLSLESIVAF